MYVERRVSFDPERDADIIRFLDSMTSHKANKLIRSLIKDHIKHRESSQLDRIEKEIQALKTIVESIRQSGVSIKPPSFDFEEADNIVKQLANNLDKIGV